MEQSLSAEVTRICHKEDEENQKGLQLNGTHQLLVYVDNVNIMGENINARLFTHKFIKNREHMFTVFLGIPQYSIHTSELLSTSATILFIFQILQSIFWDTKVTHLQQFS
jgi:hypothetical protein